jgi:hypothetical protein
MRYLPINYNDQIVYKFVEPKRGPKNKIFIFLNLIFKVCHTIAFKLRLKAEGYWYSH